MRLLDRHVEHLVDGLALVVHLERLAVVALAVAYIAGHVDVGQEMHLHLDHAVALARLAAPALHVEGEAPRAVAARARFGHAREQVADRREESRVGGRVGARRAADRALVDVDHLVEEVEPLDGVVVGGLGGGAVQMMRDGVIERVVDERRFPRAGESGDADEQPHRDLDRDVFQVIAARPGDAQLLRGIGAPPPRGHRDRLAPGKILPGERGGVAHHVLRRAEGHDLAAVNAGAGTHVDHVVGGLDRFLVVLDHDHRVSEVSESLQCLYQPRVVALVQADGRLIEHVHHAGEPGADLARQSNPLGLSTREGIGRAREREIVQAHVVQELHAVGDLAHDLVGHGALGPRQLEVLEEGLRFLQRQRRKVVDVAARDEDVARLAPQARAVALGAIARVQVLGELFLDGDGIGLAVAALEVGKDALESVLLHRAAALLAGIAEGDLLLARAVQHDVLGALPTAASRNRTGCAGPSRESPRRRATGAGRRRRASGRRR